MKSTKRYIAASLITQMILLPLVMTVGFITIGINSNNIPSFHEMGMGPDTSKLAFLLTGFLLSLLIGGAIGFIFSKRYKNKPDNSRTKYLPLLIPIVYTLIFAVLAIIFSGSNYNSEWWGAYLFKNPAFLIIGFLIFFIGDHFLFPGIEILAYTGFWLGMLFEERLNTKEVEKPSKSLKLALTLVFIACVYLSGFFSNSILRDGITEILYGETTIESDLTEFDLLQKAPFRQDNGLAKLDHSASLQYSKFEDMPRLDGATAAYPVYAAFVEAVYVGLGEYYENHKNINSKGIDAAFVQSEEFPYSIVKCSKTDQAYERLIKGETDLIFVAEPSKQHLEVIKAKGDEFLLTPIGSEAFVFFTNINNSVENLTIKQLRDIYSGKITNWKEVGGPNKSILPYQRPQNSGSQTIMQNKVMKDIKMLEPTTVTYAGGMGEIINRVASYKNAKNSIGYSFMYYSTGMIKNNQIKYISIDGVKPTPESVRNSTYPFTVPVYAVTLKSKENNDNIKKLIEWILSEEGQLLIEKTGYIPIR